MKLRLFSADKRSALAPFLQISFLTPVLVSVANALLLWPYLAKQMPSREFGSLVICVSFAAVVASLLPLGAQVSLLRDAGVADSEASLRRGRRLVGQFALGGLTVSTLGVLVDASWYVGTGALALAQAALLSELAILRGRQLEHRYALLVLLCQALLPLTLATNAEMARGPVYPLALAFSISAVVLAESLLAKQNRFEFRSLARPASFPLEGAKYIPHLLVLSFYTQGVKPLLALLYGREAAGHYQLASTIGGGALTVASMLAPGLLLPVVQSARSQLPARFEASRRSGSVYATTMLTVGAPVAGIVAAMLCPDSFPRLNIGLASALLALGSSAQLQGDLYAGVSMHRRAAGQLSASSVAGWLAAVSILATARYVQLDAALAAAASIYGGFATRRAIQKFITRANLPHPGPNVSRLAAIETIVVICLVLGGAHAA